MTDASPPRRLFGPDLRLLVPQDWLARAAVELIQPELEAHVIVTLDEVGDDATLDDYADRYGSILESRSPNYEEVRRENINLRRDRAVVRHFRWQSETGPAVEQLQVYLVEGRRGLAATVSTPRPLVEVEPAILELLGGIATYSASIGGLVRLWDDPRSRTFDALERGDLTAAPGAGRDGPGRDSGVWYDPRTVWEAAAEGVRAP